MNSNDSPILIDFETIRPFQCINCGQSPTRKIRLRVSAQFGRELDQFWCSDCSRELLTQCVNRGRKLELRISEGPDSKLELKQNQQN